MINMLEDILKLTFYDGLKLNIDGELADGQKVPLNLVSNGGTMTIKPNKNGTVKVELLIEEATMERALLAEITRAIMKG